MKLSRDLGRKTNSEVFSRFGFCTSIRFFRNGVKIWRLIWHFFSLEDLTQNYSDNFLLYSDQLCVREVSMKCFAKLVTNPV